MLSSADAILLEEIRASAPLDNEKDDATASSSAFTTHPQQQRQHRGYYAYSSFPTPDDAAPRPRISVMPMYVLVGCLVGLSAAPWVFWSVPCSGRSRVRGAIDGTRREKVVCCRRKLWY
jgi:hypothetical protein